MNPGSIPIIGLILAAAIGLKRFGLVSAGSARKYLRAGALVVDVRSADEFQAGHLANAVNLPLDELPDGPLRRVSDKNRVLLLHCLSGTRSGIARRMLKRMGYQNVFNLGSYGRAQRIVNHDAAVPA